MGRPPELCCQVFSDAFGRAGLRAEAGMERLPVRMEQSVICFLRSEKEVMPNVSYSKYKYCIVNLFVCFCEYSYDICYKSGDCKVEYPKRTEDFKSIGYGAKFCSCNQYEDE